MSSFKNILLCIIVLHLQPALAQSFWHAPLREAKKGGKNVGKTIEKGVRDTKNATSVALHDIGKATGKAADDARKTIAKGLLDASRTAGKAQKDLAAETRRVGTNAADAGTAIKNYLERTHAGYVKTISDAQDRIREGKLFDAMYHGIMDPLSNEEENAFMATQESGWLNTVASSAASAYGGPAGAAAYASWQTYRASGGNAELALRAGVITGLTSAANKKVADMSGALVTDRIKKTVLAGAVGGLAVAASGGDENQVRDAFVLSGGMVFIQDSYKNYTGHELSAKGATAEPYCACTGEPNCDDLAKAYSFDAEGNPELNTAKLNSRAATVGLGPNAYLNEKGEIAFTSPGGPALLHEDSRFMKTVAAVPGMNAMAIFHDKWVVSWQMGVVNTVATIFPAVVLTYMGTDAALNKKIRETLLAQNKDSRPQAGQPSSPSPTGSQAPQHQPPATPSNTSPGNAVYYFTSANGSTYLFGGGTVYNQWGAVINDPVIKAEALKYYPYDSSVAAQPTYTPGNFGEPASPAPKAPSAYAYVPSGFNGDPATYQEPLAVELAQKYTPEESPEKYGFENMLAINHAYAPSKSTMYLRNIANNTLVKVFVMTKVSEEDIKNGITMRLSQKAIEALKADDRSFWVEAEYEDLTVNSLNLISGSPTNGKLVFNNLRGGKWRLRIRDNFKVLYDFSDYKNDRIIQLPPMQYGYELTDVSPGQPTVQHTGLFFVQ